MVSNKKYGFHLRIELDLGVKGAMIPAEANLKPKFPQVRAVVLGYKAPHLRSPQRRVSSRLAFAPLLHHRWCIQANATCCVKKLLCLSVPSLCLSRLRESFL